MQYAKIFALGAAALLSAAVLTGCSDPVDTVKNGTIESLSKTAKVGDALGKYSGCIDKTAQWSKASEEGRDVVRFTCQLDSAAFYQGYRKDIEDAKAGIQILQKMADAFSEVLGGGKAPDLSAELNELVAATGVTRNDVTVSFAMDPKDKSKFEVSSVKTDFYWEKDRATMDNDTGALAYIYDGKPWIDSIAGDRKKFVEVLGRLYAGRTQQGGAAAPASSAAASSPAASSPAASAPASEPASSAAAPEAASASAAADKDAQSPKASEGYQKF